MKKEEADKELKEIEEKLGEIEARRFLLSKEEYQLCVRKHALMSEFYPDALQKQIDRIMELRRKSRGSEYGSDR